MTRVRSVSEDEWPDGLRAAVYALRESAGLETRWTGFQVSMMLDGSAETRLDALDPSEGEREAALSREMSPSPGAATLPPEPPGSRRTVKYVVETPGGRRFEEIRHELGTEDVTVAAYRAGEQIGGTAAGPRVEIESPDRVLVDFGEHDPRPEPARIVVWASVPAGPSSGGARRWRR